MNIDDTIAELTHMREEIRQTLATIDTPHRTTTTMMKASHLANARQSLYTAQKFLEKYEKMVCREEDPDKKPLWGDMRWITD